MLTMLSRLSVETFDADEELSDEFKYGEDESLQLGFLSSDVDAKEGGCYSLPATPQRETHTTEVGYHHHWLEINGSGVKEYASENEAQQIKNTTQGRRPRPRRRRGRRSVLRPQRWTERDAAMAAASWERDLVAAAGDDNDDVAAADDEELMHRGRGIGFPDWSCSSNNNNSNFSGGESEGGGGVGLRVITKPIGGKRSLCMDMEEVKACRDLGFELEHERLEMQPSCLSISTSTLDTATTSSAGSSPIANWRISSPGDDPRDVKARLKVWAQAVALASSSRHTT